MPEKDLILKINKPDCSELDMVSSMDVKLLTERDYYKFQAIVLIDMKTSSWLFTPENIRKKHETLFGNSIMVGFSFIIMALNHITLIVIFRLY